MTDDRLEMGLDTQNMALPLHLQRLEKSLDIRPFLNQMNGLFQDRMSDDEKSISSETSEGSNSCTNFKEEERVNKLRLYNMMNVGDERRWLQDILLSDSSDSCQSESDETITEDDFQDMLKFHILRKKYQGRFYQKPENIQYQYYGAGLLSACDRFPEHQKLIVGNKKKKEKKCDKKVVKVKKDKSVRTNNNSLNINNSGNNVSCSSNNKIEENRNEHDYQEENNWNKIIPKEEEIDENELDMLMKQPRGRGRKKHNSKSPEMMAMRRRKIWIMMSKKELGKVQRAKANNHKEMLINCKKLAQNCMKYWRQKAMQSQKNMKETIWRAKRLTREMQTYWKRYDRVERETRRRLEKEAEEQRKMDVEMIEAKRQQRKLNFLITQTELYAHFMSRKVGQSLSTEEQLRILSQLDEEKNPRLIGIDDYDSELMKQKAKKNAIEAFDHEKARTKQFDTVSSSTPQEFRLSDTPDNLEHPQPTIFKGNLKGYQLKGMNWLANLYDQGINGILADEMGLGKTVQSIAFLCHIAEKYSVWGPFLIISPSSTLHNWQQEMARFVPTFKVVPYWGNPQERKILRQFWDTKDLHTKEASFHVVITSYQLFIADYKYFNRIKWQYMILDEAQAIKSSSSMRWKLLLGFSCRNRLLLSGTPIQNSMAELWALLHFIMPTLFDSHEEFNEWFSKDIESHAENKTGIDEKHLSRLHMILKPFMLRRIKKDVENELSDKIEIMVYCPLTTRQKLLYSALKQKIRIEDLLHYTVGASSGSNSASGSASGSVNPNSSNSTVSESVPNDKSLTSNLMNLVMQFRKVCNHPELFERRDAKSPLFINTESYEMPSLLYEKGVLNLSIPSIQHLLYNKFNIFSIEYIHRALFYSQSSNCFSFSRLINISPGELNEIFMSGILYRLCHNYLAKRQMRVKRYWEDWWVDGSEENKTELPVNTMLILTKKFNSLFLDTDFVFTKKILEGEAIYTHTTHTIHSIPETMAHRILRSSKHISNQSIKSTRTHAMIKPELEEEPKLMLLPEHRHLQRPPIIRVNQPTIIPYFVCETNPKVQASQRKLYVSNSSAACAWRRHEQCGGSFGQKVLRIGCEQALLSTPEYDPIIAVDNLHTANMFTPDKLGGLSASTPITGWSNIIVPDKQTLVTDAGKLSVLDSLLRRLKEQGHRVLIYSQMTKMIDLLEEYMYHRKHTFMRLDGSSKISDRRDMVADFQKRADIFVFLLSTRAGGLGINLTAADTVIFYDSDWNPTVDQQAMDRAHRLGQTKQVTVYRLICKGTIEERILQRAREKSEIQRMVISGGNFKPDTLKPKEVVSLLLDDEEIEAKYSQRSEERKQSTEETRLESNMHSKERDRKRKLTALPVKDGKKPCLENKSENINNIQQLTINNDKNNSIDEYNEEYHSTISPPKSEDETSNEGLVVDVDGPFVGTSNCRPPRPLAFNEPQKVSKIGNLNFGMGSGMKNRMSMRGTSKRGRPRGSRRGGPVGGKGRGLTIPDVVTGSPNSGSIYSSNITTLPSSTTSSTSDNQIIQSGPADGDGPSTVGPLGPMQTIGHMVSARGQTGIRRGPGRPRLRPTGPGNQGHRMSFSSSVANSANSNHGKRIQFSSQPRTNQTPSVQPKTVSFNNQITSNSLNDQSTIVETRPFGFYTQQQLPNRDE